MKHHQLFLLAAATFLLGVPAAAQSPSADRPRELNVYTHRHYAVDRQIHARFTADTGIAVRVVNAGADQLIERLRQEGKDSPADVLVTVDAGRMQRAAAAGLLQPTRSEVLEARVPAAFRDAEGRWFGFARRARVIVRARERVAEGAVQRYEDLADPRWRGRLLIRSSSSTYNQGLLASIIAANGAEQAEVWAAGVVANLARDPQGGDRDQVRAVAEGLADLAVSNSYYVGLLANSSDPQDRAAYAAIAIVFPNQGDDDRGTHVNLSVAGITAAARNVDAARAYLQFLTSEEIQDMIANGSYEYPIDGSIERSPVHREWGTFRADQSTFPELGARQALAEEIFERVGWR